MQTVQKELAQLKHDIELIVPEQEVLTESLDQVTILHCIAAALYFHEFCPI